MKMFYFIRSNVFIGLSLIFVLGYLLGVLNLYFSDKHDSCVMTYMFEYPQFVRLSMLENKVYPQYGLYAYSEGRFTERARKMWFDGVPVLFLPGNSGSHMQARSLASVALRKALSGGYDYHFDYFTISYNEELSGLYGGVLQSQTSFAAACITKILSLYKENKYTKSVPTTVILIGHSMGGLVAKRLLAHPGTINTTSIAITLAAPIESPVMNFDTEMNNYYMSMDYEWDVFINSDPMVKEKKMLISLGNGPRDILMPSGLTSSKHSSINTLTTSIPGVWLSPNHVCIVWCKQVVMAINRYLFSIIDPLTEQISENQELIMSRARQYFEANRSMVLNDEIPKSNVTMMADAFWYEDNRRIYQVSRPDIDKMTYLMIRLVKFPQNRFVAVEAVNVSNRDWIYGCNAKHAYNTYRYCKDAVSLSELSRWTGAATGFSKRKLATINLHSVKEQHPDWTHVIVKVSPTRKPIILNIDINDHASRVIHVDLPAHFDFGKTVIKPETEPESLYYELILRDFDTIYQTYLLYIEPVGNCGQFHVSAEMHVPWAKNHEQFHYFTHLKKSPMKLRLFKSNPNVTGPLDVTEHVKITLLLDPHCQFTISISRSWYHQLAQLVRNYTPVLVPYVAAIVLLVARSNVLSLRENGACLSLHGALTSESVKPYYALVFARLAVMVIVSLPFLSFLLENAGWKNLELQYFVKSLLVLPAYMTALGILNIVAAVVTGVMMFSSQFAYKLFFRMLYRGGGAGGERVSLLLRRAPLGVSAALVCAAPASCGAASLVAGAAFYGFMISKMYEDYLEDYGYKLMSRIASKLCRLFYSKVKKQKSETVVVSQSNTETNKTIENVKTEESLDKVDDGKSVIAENESNDINETKRNSSSTKEQKSQCDSGTNSDLDEDFNNINFHMMLFFMWLCVTMINVPVLLTWARNFKYSMVLKTDTSYYPGLVMSVCSSCVWQINGPRRNLRHYETVSALLFTMAVFILALGPLSLMIINYGVTLMFAVITLQQLFDKEVMTSDISLTTNVSEDPGEKDSNSKNNKNDSSSNGVDKSSECDPCNENRIFNTFKNLQDKFDVTNTENS